MKRLQIVDHNINIGHCNVYSRDFVTNILWFIKLLNSAFRILNSEFRIPHFEKKLWMVHCNLVFWRCHIRVRARGGARDPKLEQFKQLYSLIYMSFYDRQTDRQTFILLKSYK